MLINRTTWPPKLPNVSIVNNWIVPENVSPIVGVGRLTLHLGSQSFDFGDLSAIGVATFSQASLPSGVPGVSLTRVSWNNDIGQPLLTVEFNSNPVTNAVQSATITDNANNFDWSRQDVREVFSNPGSATSSGITVTSTQLDGGARVITVEREAGVTTNKIYFVVAENLDLAEVVDDVVARVVGGDFRPPPRHSCAGFRAVGVQLVFACATFEDVEAPAARDIAAAFTEDDIGVVLVDHAVVIDVMSSRTTSR